MSLPDFFWNNLRNSEFGNPEIVKKSGNPEIRNPKSEIRFDDGECTPEVINFNKISGIFFFFFFEIFEIRGAHMGCQRKIRESGKKNLISHFPGRLLRCAFRLYITTVSSRMLRSPKVYSFCISYKNPCTPGGVTPVFSRFLGRKGEYGPTAIHN